ncbi:hypothetical protein N2152v2_009220 [Parachlorella kessleri]
MSTLVDEYPLLVAPERPPTILERVYLKGDLLAVSASLHYYGFLLIGTALKLLWGIYFGTLAIIRQPSFQAIKAIRPRLTLDFHNLGLVLSDGSTILSGVTGRFAHSKVSAVMGPSGAGKSTFLNVLAGRATQYGKVSGAVRVNKRDIDIRRLQAITGFVPQEDLVHEDLTVRENLAYSARLRLPRGKASHEQQGIVEDVMDMLQLRHVQHQVVGTAEKRGVSGGQRKRVNIGLELVTVPSLLFLDEPTSGLDATAAVDIIQALKRMAQLGMNVVAVVHQPRYSIFTLFDTVLLLGTGGSVPPVGSGSFQPDDLNGLWHTYGLSWVRTQAKLTPPEPAQRQLPPDAARLDPGQLQLLEHAFDDCDSNADGAVTAAELRELLRGLGLQPTKRDVQTIMGELSIPRTGLLSKEAFMQYVRCGGRVQAAARRPSVYRVYSIEQYTIANVLSELSAAQIAPGLIERGATMKEIAAAVMSQAGASGSAQSGSLRAHMPAGGAAAATTATTAGPAAATLASAREDLPCRRSTSFQEPPEAVIPDAGSSFLNRDSAASLLLYTHERIAASDAWPPASLQPGQPHAPQQESPAGPFAMPASSHLSCAVGRSRTDTLDSSRSDTPMSVRIPPEAFQSPFAAAAALPAPAALQGPLQQEGSVAQSSVHSTLDGPLALSSGAMCGGALKLAGKGSGTTCGSAVEGKAKQLPAVQPCSTGGSMASSSGGRSSSGSSDGSRRGYRSTPGVARQFVVLLVRAGTKWARGWTSKFLDLLLLLLAGVVTGAMHGSHSGPWEMRGYTAQVMLTLGTLAAAAALSVFGKDRVVFGREQASGIRPLPYFLAHSVIQLIDITIQPLIFLAAYYSLTLPSIAFSQLYLAGLLVTWYCSSLGCLMSVVLRPANALVATIVVALMLGGFLNGVNPKYREMSPTMKRVSGLSFDRWVTEAVTIMEFSAYPQHMWPMTRAIIDNAGYCGMDQHPDGLLGNLHLDQLDLSVPPFFEKSSQQAVRDHRLSLERLLDEASHSHNGSQAETLEGKEGLFRASSAKQLDNYATAYTAPPRPTEPASETEDKSLQAAADSLAAKLQEQLKPWLLQQVQEVLAGARGGMDLQAELAGLTAKVQAALSPEEIVFRAASSIAEALPSVLADQLRDSQELSMEGSICAPKTQHNGVQPNPQTTKLVSTSADSGQSSRLHDEDGTEQQATSAMKPAVRQEARTASLVEVAAMACESQQLPAEVPKQAVQTAMMEAKAGLPLVQQEPMEQDEAEEGAERPQKRPCHSTGQLQAIPGPHTTKLPAGHPPAPPLLLPDLLGPAATTTVLDTLPGGPAGGVPHRKGRRTNYVKLREMEASIEEARLVEQHLRAAIASAEHQHSSILEENQQLWNAVAHVNATLHAGRAALLAEAATALKHEQYQQQQGPSHQSQQDHDLDPSAAGTSHAGTAPAAGGISSPCLDDDDDDLFSASPDPLCLAEACGMLFSPAPAAGKAAKLLGGKQQKVAAGGAAGTAAAGAAGPANKPRKLFEDELAAAAAGCCAAGVGAGSWEAGLQLLEDLPHLEFVH